LLTYGGRGLLDGLEQDVRVLWVEETLKLAAAGAIRFAISLLLIRPFLIASLTSQDNTRFQARVVTSS